MKFTLCLTAAILIFIAGYNYGLRDGIKGSAEEVENYRTLYNQAIMWQNLELENLPYKAPNVKLKKKEE